MIIDTLWSHARAKAAFYSRELFLLRGLWKSEYVMQPHGKERIFGLSYVLAQTAAQGCSYYDPRCFDPELDSSLLGMSVLDLDVPCLPLNIAILDAVYAVLGASPDQVYTLSGNLAEKGCQRAGIIRAEALGLLRHRAAKSGRRKRIVNVGVVGDFIQALSAGAQLEVFATDLDESLVGTMLHGVQVEHGGRTLERVAEADLAVVTGMTLATGTLDDILITATRNGTAVIMFAATGANLAPEYRDMGVDVVVNEPFPFYIVSGGSADVGVYRR